MYVCATPYLPPRIISSARPLNTSFMREKNQILRHMKHKVRSVKLMLMFAVVNARVYDTSVCTYIRERRCHELTLPLGIHLNS